MPWTPRHRPSAAGTSRATASVGTENGAADSGQAWTSRGTTGGSSGCVPRPTAATVRSPLALAHRHHHSLEAEPTDEDAAHHGEEARGRLLPSEAQEKLAEDMCLRNRVGGAAR